jgi:hypothetical protein
LFIERTFKIRNRYLSEERIRKMSNSKIRQDLPPPGGYKPIPYIRIPAKQYFSGESP